MVCSKAEIARTLFLETLHGIELAIYISYLNIHAFHVYTFHFPRLYFTSLSNFHKIRLFSYSLLKPQFDGTPC
jgi:hypothetical protein